jgi:hypothetical protein
MAAEIASGVLVPSSAKALPAARRIAMRSQPARTATIIKGDLPIVP